MEITSPTLSIGSAAVFGHGIDTAFNGMEVSPAYITIAGAVWHNNGWWYYEASNTSKLYAEYSIVTFA